MGKLLDYDSLRDLGIRYSKPHLWRWERDGKFPKRVKLNGPNSRTFWREADVAAWLSSRVVESASASAA